MTPAKLKANGLWNHFTGRKKWTITCGKCSHSWVEKVLIDEPSSAVCPCYKTQNTWSIIAFQEVYRARTEA